MGCKKQTYLERVESVFDTDMILSVSARGVDNSDLDEIYDFANELGALINLNIPTSQVSIFNAMGEGRLQVNEHVYNLVNLSKTAWEESGGAFDVTLGALSKLWKVDSENIFTSHEGPLPSLQDLTAFSSTINGVQTEKVGDEYYLVKTQAQATIDLGGIAKGYLCDEIIERLKSKNCTSAMIDLAGNLALLGEHYTDAGEKESWRVGVKSPTRAGYLCGINVSDSAVVTAGTYERYYEKDGVKYCHIINPFTKLPVGVTLANESYANTINHVISCTVYSLSGAQCDALATATCVLGLEQGKALLEQHNAKAIIVTADGKYTTVGDISFMDGYEIEGLDAV